MGARLLLGAIQYRLAVVAEADNQAMVTGLGACGGWLATHCWLNIAAELDASAHVAYLVYRRK